MLKTVELIIEHNSDFYSKWDFYHYWAKNFKDLIRSSRMSSTQNGLKLTLTTFIKKTFSQRYEGFINITTIINDIDAIVTSSVALYGESFLNNEQKSRENIIKMHFMFYLRNNSKCHSKCPRCLGNSWPRWWWYRHWYRKYRANKLCPRFN